MNIVMKIGVTLFAAAILCIGAAIVFKLPAQPWAAVPLTLAVAAVVVIVWGGEQ